MATVHAEYLDYKERTTQQLSEKKQRISELKDQLANLDVKQYNEAPKTVHDLAKDAVGHIFSNLCFYHNIIIYSIYLFCFRNTVISNILNIF